MKKIWWYEDTETSNVPYDSGKYEQMTVEELSLEVHSTESKIEYLEVLIVLIINNNKYIYEIYIHKDTSFTNLLIYLLNVKCFKIYQVI